MSNTIALIGPTAETLINFRGQLIKDMASAGHRVIAFAPDYEASDLMAIRSLGAEPIQYPLERNGMNPWQDLRSLLALRQALICIRPDMTLAHTAKAAIWGTIAAWLARVPRRVAMIEGLGFFFTESGAKISIKRRFLRSLLSQLYRLALSRAHRVFMLNPDDISEFISLGLVDADKALCIGGIGVDLTEWSVMPLPSHPVTFCLAARLLREKGVCEYMEAVRSIKARYPDARFLLLGRPDTNPGSLSAADVRQWVEDGLIEWPGHVPMRDWLSQTSVFVLPSYREGVPRSTQEAMAMGRPIITTDVPGCRETVVDGINGFLVPPRNATALAIAMEKFMREPDLLVRMGAASRHMAEEKFDVHRVNAIILRELLN
jgi:glycosyltransferase involved in cell wall biosynthesis